MPNQYSLNRVAIDGLAASGKSTVAKVLAEKLELNHLDTGAMYRVIAHCVLEAGIDPGNEYEVVKLAKSLDITIVPESVCVNGKDVTKEIRSKETTEVVSQVASHYKVRKELRKKQLLWIDKNGGGVLEGRDIGTVILPKADLKVFVVASDEIRAERRAKESGRLVDEVLISIRERDELDKNRKHGPLIQAQDAMRIDTTNKTVDEVVEEILGLVQEQYETRLEKLTKGMNPLNTQKFFGSLISKFVRQLAYLVFKIYFRGKVVNRKNIPKSGAIILAPAAHRSNLDVPLVGAVSKRLLKYMAKDSLYIKNRFWSRLLMAMGGFPVRRDRLDRKALLLAIEFLKKEQGLVIFPEGERKVGPRIFPLLGGVIWLSIQTGAPILPIGFAGGDIAMPIGKKIVFPKKIAFIIGEPIYPPTQRVSKEEQERLGNELREVLQELYDKALNLRK